MSTVTLYHGTRASIGSILEHGLLAGGPDATDNPLISKEAILERVLAEFGLTREEVPSYLYQGELDYEKNYPVHLHFSPSFENAAGYSDMGGEPAYCIRSAIMEWQEATRLGQPDTCLHAIDRQLSREIRAKAKRKNGLTRIVIAVEFDLDDPNLDDGGREFLRRVLNLINEGKVREGYFEGCITEIRYYGNISASKLSIYVIPENYDCHDGGTKWS